MQEGAIQEGRVSRAGGRIVVVFTTLLVRLYYYDSITTTTTLLYYYSLLSQGECNTGVLRGRGVECGHVQQPAARREFHLAVWGGSGRGWGGEGWE